jgi:hypothetical protein
VNNASAINLGFDHRGAAQAVRPDERHPGTRHLRRVPGMHPAHGGQGQPAHS